MIDRRRLSMAGNRAIALGREVVSVVREREITLLLLITWFYVAAVLLLVGATVNYVLAGTGSAKSPAPDSPD